MSAKSQNRCKTLIWLAFGKLCLAINLRQIPKTLQRALVAAPWHGQTGRAFVGLLQIPQNPFAIRAPLGHDGLRF
jgi:hypothetical protein